MPQSTEHNAATRIAFAVCSAGTAVYMAVLTAASFVVVDIGAGMITSLWKLLRLPRRSLIRFQSFVLRRWMSVFIGHFEYYSRMTLKLTGTAFRPGESAIIICNHRSWMDTVILYSLARQVGHHGDVKFFAKRSLLVVPVYGIAGVILDVVIFIVRDIGKAGLLLERTFAALSDRRRQWPYWMISYLEGTRRTCAKLAESQAFAKKRDLKPLRHVLQPRTKGFISSVNALRGSATAIYDVTLGYKETDTEERNIVPSFMDSVLTTDTAPRVTHVHQRRLPMTEIPEHDEELKAWLYSLYEEKDKLLEEFHATGRFPGPELDWRRMSPSYFSSTLLLFWLSFVVLLVLFTKLVYVLIGKA